MNALYTMDAVPLSAGPMAPTALGVSNVDAVSKVMFTLQAGDSVHPAAGAVALLLSDPLAVLAILGGLATVVLNVWLFRMASRHSGPPNAEGDGPTLPRGRAALFLAPRALQEEGLTFGDVIRDIPADPASLFVYTLLAASITLVWAANRPKRGR